MAERKRGPGRPPLAVPRNHAVTVRLTAEEYAAAARLADDAGIAATEWARIAVVASLGK